jgi:hypothetical protein
MPARSTELQGLVASSWRAVLWIRCTAMSAITLWPAKVGRGLLAHLLASCRLGTLLEGARKQLAAPDVSSGSICTGTARDGARAHGSGYG